ncbi:MAG: LysR family transcriptional regulator [Desulfobacteraceae bacterium]|nr:MAG: LysR family transcriptional regulator [Desulfobacteraceae bacterium]
MSVLEIRHLKMVRTIAETGTMTRAASVLFLSQSALSQQLKDVEERLGTRLFYRTRKKMMLTPMGRKVQSTADQVIRSLEDTETDIARMVNGEAGELRVGTQCIFCYRWLPRVFKAFQGKFPNVELEIGNSVNAVDELNTETYNLIISVLPDSPESACKKPLFRDEMVAVLPPDHPLSRKSYLELEDFALENLISARSKSRNWFFQKTLKPRDIHPKRHMTVEDPGAMIEMVAAGFGMAMAPKWAILPKVGEGRVHIASVTRKGLHLTWQAMFLENDPIPVFMKEFIHLVERAGITHPEGPQPISTKGPGTRAMNR